MSSWDSEKLWLKAKLFIDRANENDQASPEFAFWCALSLECLARSALTHIHPSLNADPRDVDNILYGFGYELTSKPRSLPVHSVHIRLEKILENFGKPQEKLCDFMALLRNAHLHTSEMPYENLTTAKWLPRFYETVKVLNEFIGKKMSDFLGDTIASSASKLIHALSEELLGVVKSKIAAHKKVFGDKPEEERKKLLQASQVATFSLPLGKVSRTCPSCGAHGTLSGDKVKEFPEKYEEGELIIDVQYLAMGFKCLSCGLNLKGVEEIAHTDIDTHFVETVSTSLHDLYEPEYGPEYDNM